MAERAHPEDPGFQEGSPYRANLFKRYAFARKFTEGKTVVDVPCGVGWGTSLLKAKHRIGIDISADAIAYAKSHYPSIDFLAGNMANIPLKDKSVDVVICLEGFEHVDKATGIKFLGEVERIVKENGLLVMTIPVILPGGSHTGNPYHLHEPTLSDLKNILAQSFCTQSMDIIKGPDGPVAYFVGSPKNKKPEVSNFSHKSRDVGYLGKGKSNVLLTTSAAPVESPFSTSEKRPPIGLGFLISVLRNAGHEVFFIDNYLEPSDFLETDYLQKHNIDFVGIYVNTICFRDTLRMLGRLQQLREQHKWDGKIIVGGPHTTVAPDTIAGYVDHIVQGEGEQAIVDIVEGRVTDRVICYPRIEDLDRLAPPAWDFFVNLPYKWTMEFIDESPVFTMNTSRGCPFKCQFCSVGSIWGKKYTYFSAERIVSEIEYLMKTYGAKGIYFREDNFTLNRPRLEQFCRLLIEKGIKISWVCESRVSNLDRASIELMARAGLKGFYFGVESGSQRMLDLMEKGITVEQTRAAFALCHEANVKAAASVIVGVPGETEADLVATDSLLNEIKPAATWVNVFVGIPDSKLYRYSLDNKLYEYVDDRGLVYLQGHDVRVKRYYGTGLNAFIPTEECRKDMTNRLRVSVLMAVHNGEEFVGQALQSIYDQSFQNFEVIIVDDASTDRTAETLLNMKDSRTFIYRNARNLGLTKSLNKGLKLCRGEFVARMDADDLSYPQRFEKQLEFFAEHPDTTVVGCWCHRIDQKGRISGAYDGRSTEPEDIRRELLVGNCIAHGTAMVRRDCLKGAGGYKEEYEYSQDHDLWLRLSEKVELRNLPEYLYGLRFWPGNITAGKKPQQDDYSAKAISEAKARKADSRKRIPTLPVANREGASAGPKFSIIMANYNNSNYIGEAIESILAQTFSDWELIIVDDGSTDGSLDVIRGYLVDKRIRLVKHETNRSYIAALKTGISNVRSEFFGILDSDDCLRKDAIEIMHAEHSDNPEAGLIYSQFVHCDEKLEPGYLGFGAAIAEGLTNLDRHVVSAFRTFKLRDYHRTGGYDENILYAEDRDICYKMEEVSKLKFVEECLYFYRELSDSQSHDSAKTIFGRQMSQMARFKAFRRRGLKAVVGIMRDGKGRHFLLRDFQDCYRLGLYHFNGRNYEQAQQVFSAMLESGKEFVEHVQTDRANYDVDGFAWILGCIYDSSLKLARCFFEQNKPASAAKTYTELLEADYLDISVEQRNAISSVMEKLESKLALTERPPERKVEKIEQTTDKGPLVSVIMPAYNAEKYIRQAIESVLIQNYRHFELLIINDGSTDSTEEIVQSYKDEHIRYFKQENKGLAATHNEGIRKSRGEFLIKVDADDFVTADFISRHIEAFDKHPEADLVYCDDHLIEEDGQPIRIITRPEYSDRRILIRDLFGAGFPVVPFRTCIRRRVFDEIGLFDESLRIGEDYDMMRRFVKAGLKAQHLKAPLYYRRLASDSLSRQYSVKKARAYFEIVKSYAETFSREELFPDVQWEQIPPGARQLHFKCLVALNFISLGQNYIEANLPSYAQTALVKAEEELDGCLEIDPGNGQVQHLLEKCQRIEASLSEPAILST